MAPKTQNHTFFHDQNLNCWSFEVSHTNPFGVPQTCLDQTISEVSGVALQRGRSGCLHGDVGWWGIRVVDPLETGFSRMIP